MRKVLTLLQKVSGVDFSDLRDSVDDGRTDFGAIVYQVRDFYDAHVLNTTVPLTDLLKHAKRGDLLLRFSDHTRLSEMLTEGTLDKIYRRTLRSKHEELGDGF